MSAFVNNTGSAASISFVKSIKCWDPGTVTLTEIEGWAAEYSWIFIQFSGDRYYSSDDEICAVTGLIPMSDFVGYVRNACRTGNYTTIYLPGIETSSSKEPHYTIEIRKNSSQAVTIREPNSTNDRSVGFRYLALYGMK